MKKKRPFDTSLLSGTWKGEYTYGDGYDLNVLGLSASFVMELEFTEEQCRGICIDEQHKGHFEESITIEGIYHDNYISFIKKYPFRTYSDEEGNTKVDREMPGQSIHYTGTLRRRGISFYYFFEGTWDLTDQAIDEEGKSFMYTVSGTWTMALK